MIKRKKINKRLEPAVEARLMAICRLAEKPEWKALVEEVNRWAAIAKNGLYDTKLDKGEYARGTLVGEMKALEKLIKLPSKSRKLLTDNQPKEEA